MGVVFWDFGLVWVGQAELVGGIWQHGVDLESFGFNDRDFVISGRVDFVLCVGFLLTLFFCRCSIDVTQPGK